MDLTTNSPTRRVVAPPATAARYEALKCILIERQRTVLSEVQDKIRDVRSARSGHDDAVLDTGETSAVAIQEDIAFALIQMKAETLTSIDQALARFTEGTYGLCFECGDEIALLRLRALPFAVRCKNCEQAREMAQQRERIQARRVSPRLGLDSLSINGPRPAPDRAVAKLRRIKKGPCAS